MQTKGISHELTAPYIPQQNGMAERLNRTLLEKMGCLLIWSELPKSYWDVALLHSNWLCNRQPTSALQGGIPIEAWSGKAPSFQKFHTFGCLVQYLKVGHDEDKQSKKFASRTTFAIFLGMPSQQARYLVYDALRTGVLVRDDVRFYDNIPGYPRLVTKKMKQPTPSHKTTTTSPSFQWKRIQPQHQQQLPQLPKPTRRSPLLISFSNSQLPSMRSSCLRTQNRELTTTTEKTKLKGKLMGEQALRVALLTELQPGVELTLPRLVMFFDTIWRN